jgi:hypothetical protein
MHESCFPVIQVPSIMALETSTYSSSDWEISFILPFGEERDAYVVQQTLNGINFVFASQAQQRLEFLNVLFTNTQYSNIRITSALAMPSVGAIILSGFAANASRIAIGDFRATNVTQPLIFMFDVSSNTFVSTLLGDCGSQACAYQPNSTVVDWLVRIDDHSLLWTYCPTSSLCQLSTLSLGAQSIKLRSTMPLQSSGGTISLLAIAITHNARSAIVFGASNRGALDYNGENIVKADPSVTRSLPFQFVVPLGYNSNTYNAKAQLLGSGVSSQTVLALSDQRFTSGWRLVMRVAEADEYYSASYTSISIEQFDTTSPDSMAATKCSAMLLSPVNVTDAQQFKLALLPDGAGVVALLRLADLANWRFVTLPSGSHVQFNHTNANSNWLLVRLDASCALNFVSTQAFANVNDTFTSLAVDHYGAIFLGVVSASHSGKNLIKSMAYSISA